MALNRPSASAWLRAASVFAGLYCLGHMAGCPWTPGRTDAAKAVVSQMQSVQFAALGAQRTYWDFYFGFGLISGADLALLSALLWWLASVARRDALLVRPMLWPVITLMIANAYFTARYFFIMPVAFALLIAALVAAALVSARANTTAA
jgi:hypothetical protein